MDLIDRAWGDLFGMKPRATSAPALPAVAPRPADPAPARTYYVLRKGQRWVRHDGGRTITVVEITNESATVEDASDASRFELKQTTLRRAYRLEAP